MTPKLSTADSPARVIVDLPGTVMATGQSHITVGNAGVKGVRIGMDGQTPPTTRVVVDLEHACRYELNSGGGWKAGVDAAYATLQPAASASVPKTVAQTAAAPASRSMSPFAPRVIEVAPKAQPVAVSAPVAPKAAMESAVPASDKRRGCLERLCIRRADLRGQDERWKCLGRARRARPGCGGEVFRQNGRRTAAGEHECGAIVADHCLPALPSSRR